jgi:hypothetical protein
MEFGMRLIFWYGNPPHNCGSRSGIAPDGQVLSRVIRGMETLDKACEQICQAEGALAIRLHWYVRGRLTPLPRWLSTAWLFWDRSGGWRVMLVHGQDGSGSGWIGKVSQKWALK